MIAVVLLLRGAEAPMSVSSLPLVDLLFLFFFPSLRLSLLLAYSKLSLVLFLSFSFVLLVLLLLCFVFFKKNLFFHSALDLFLFSSSKSLFPPSFFSVFNY
jgi:hypothetical protein